MSALLRKRNLDCHKRCPLSAISGRGIAISHSMLGGHEGPSLDRREALAGRYCWKFSLEPSS